MHKALLLALLLLGLSAQAQSNLYGTIRDEKNGVLPGASVEAFHLPDSTKKVAITDENGSFVLSLAPGKYWVRVRFIGYQNLERSLQVGPSATAFGSAQMQPNVQLLKDAVVTAQAVPVQQKGDTTQMNAEAFSTLSDASAEDLIKKLPGMQVNTDGTVKAQGEQVQQVLVDGKPFFGTDPSAALKNLPADMIDKVQVYNRQSDQAKFSGVNDGEDSKTINLITKKDRKQGNFGRVSAGLGTDNRFQLDGKYNLFKGDSRLTLTAGLNNINEQSFQDMVFSGRPRFFGGGMMMLSGGMSGLNQLGNFGAQYQDQWAKNLEVNMSYSLSNKDQDQDEKRNAVYLSEADSGRTINQRTTTYNNSLSHRMDARIQWDLDSSNTILFTPEVRIGTSSGTSMETSSTSLNSGLLNTIFATEQNSNQNWSTNGELQWQHKFSKEGRTLSWEVDFETEVGSGDGNFRTVTNFLDAGTTTELIRLTDQKSSTEDYATRAVYTEPVGKLGRLLFEYRYGMRTAISENISRPAADASPDTVLSQDVESQFISHRPAVGYSYRGSSWGTFLRMQYQIGELRTTSAFPALSTYQATYADWLTTASIRYETKMHQFRVFYRGGVDLPSASQLQDRYTISSPLRISSGNSTLDRAYSNRVFLRYNWANPESGWNFSLFAMPNWQNSYIGQQTLIARSDTALPGGVVLPNGGQWSRPVNLDGFFAWNVDGNLGFPLKKLKGNGSFGLGYATSNIPSMFDGETVLTVNNTVNSSVGYTSNFGDRLDVNWTSRFNLSEASNSSLGGSNNYHWWQHEVGARGRLGKGWVLGANLEQRSYVGLDLPDPDYWLLRASIGYKFSKDRGEFRLTAFDLLNQNQSLSRNIQTLYTEDVEQLVLGQYFMLSFIWEWKSFSGKAPEGMGERRFMMRH